MLRFIENNLSNFKIMTNARVSLVGLPLSSSSENEEEENSR